MTRRLAAIRTPSVEPGASAEAGRLLGLDGSHLHDTSAGFNRGRWQLRLVGSLTPAALMLVRGVRLDLDRAGALAFLRCVSPWRGHIVPARRFPERQIADS